MAMAVFTNVLSATEISIVADFIREEFSRATAHNTRHHTQENGWRNHERYKIAFPFATGMIALDTANDALTTEQQQAKHLLMNACISCHDRTNVNSEGAAWSN